MEPKRFEEIKREFYSLLPDDRTEDMADLIAEVERLQAIIRQQNRQMLDMIKEDVDMTADKVSKLVKEKG